MADLLHRTTKRLLLSVNTPTYVPAWRKGEPAPEDGDWIVNPDLAAVKGLPTKYWRLDGNKVSPMDDAEQAAVDQAEADARKADAIAASKAALTDDRLTRAIVKVIADHAGGGKTADDIKAAIGAAIDAEA
jgi:hypothetical protein